MTLRRGEDQSSEEAPAAPARVAPSYSTFIFQLPVTTVGRPRSAPPPPAKQTNKPPPPAPAGPAGPNRGDGSGPALRVHLCAPRDGAGPQGTAPGRVPGEPAAPPRRRPPTPQYAPRAASARPRRGAPLTEDARGAPSGSPSPTGRCSPPASSSRRDLRDSGAATATPAAEPEKAAAAEPSPAGARSRPHLPPPPPRRGSVPRPAAPARGCRAAKHGRALRVPGRHSANRPAAARLEAPCGSGPLPDAVAVASLLGAWLRGLREPLPGV